MEPDVFRRVASMVDQGTRVACCMASRRLHAELVKPGGWPSVAVYACTPRAVLFIEAVECTDLSVSCPDVRVVEAFLDSLNAPLRRLVVSVRGSRVLFPRACGLGSSVARFPRLEDLVIECGHLPRALCGLVFPVALPALRSLRVTEDTIPARLEVYLRGAGMAALEDVCLRVSTCDVLSCLPSLPRLRFLKYHASRDKYEDACFEDARLCSVDLHVSSDVGWTYLVSALARARYINQLTITSSTDLDFQAPLEVRDMVIRATKSDMTVQFTLTSARVLTSLAVVDAGGDGWVVRFTECGTWDRFLLFTKNTDMYIGRWGSNVTVEF